MAREIIVKIHLALVDQVDNVDGEGEHPLPGTVYEAVKIARKMVVLTPVHIVLPVVG